MIIIINYSKLITHLYDKLFMKMRNVYRILVVYWKFVRLNFVVLLPLLSFDLWPWKSKGFQILLRTKYVPSLVKIHWRMLILECSQGCYDFWLPLWYLQTFFCIDKITLKKNFGSCTCSHLCLLSPRQQSCEGI
jgi:hypothetical protein